MPGFIAVEMVRQPHLVGSKMPPDELVLEGLEVSKLIRFALLFYVRRWGMGRFAMWG